MAIITHALSRTYVSLTAGDTQDYSLQRGGYPRSEVTPIGVEVFRHSQQTFVSTQDFVSAREDDVTNQQRLAGKYSYLPLRAFMQVTTDAAVNAFDFDRVMQLPGMNWGGPSVPSIDNRTIPTPETNASAAPISRQVHLGDTPNNNPPTPIIVYNEIATFVPPDPPILEEPNPSFACGFARNAGTVRFDYYAAYLVFPYNDSFSGDFVRYIDFRDAFNPVYTGTPASAL